MFLLPVLESLLLLLLSMAIKRVNVETALSMLDASFSGGELDDDVGSELETDLGEDLIAENSEPKDDLEDASKDRYADIGSPVADQQERSGSESNEGGPTDSEQCDHSESAEECQEGASNSEARDVVHDDPEESNEEVYCEESDSGMTSSDEGSTP